jgi:hypothetical protein
MNRWDERIVTQPFIPVRSSSSSSCLVFYFLGLGNRRVPSYLSISTSSSLGSLLCVEERRKKRKKKISALE